MPITIRQDCFFDYLYVKDLADIFTYFIKNNPKYDNYNVSTALPIKLSEIAKICIDFKNSSLPINILNEGFNFEYTASNERLKNEFTDFSPTSLKNALYDMTNNQ
jgi:GDP-L-fucose synthase